jgi:hypothetical protein
MSALEIAIGVTSSLTIAAREKFALEAALADHKRDTAKRTAELEREISARSLVLETAAAGLDYEKLALARTIINVRGSFEKAGTDRLSVVRDAVKQLATGEPIRQIYGDLWRCAFGTKDYDGWHGQRCDSDYGCGPRHGHVIFSVGLTADVRKKSHADLTSAEIEAAIYYLTNLERVQAAEKRAAP